MAEIKPTKTLETWRKRQAKKRSLQVVNEHFGPDF